MTETHHDAVVKEYRRFAEQYDERWMIGWLWGVMTATVQKPG